MQQSSLEPAGYFADKLTKREKKKIKSHKSVKSSLSFINLRNPSTSIHPSPSTSQKVRYSRSKSANHSKTKPRKSSKAKSRANGMQEDVFQAYRHKIQRRKSGKAGKYLANNPYTTDRKTRQQGIIIQSDVATASKDRVKSSSNNPDKSVIQQNDNSASIPHKSTTQHMLHGKESSIKQKRDEFFQDQSQSQKQSSLPTYSMTSPQSTKSAPQSSKDDDKPTTDSDNTSQTISIFKENDCLKARVTNLINEIHELQDNLLQQKRFIQQQQRQIMDLQQKNRSYKEIKAKLTKENKIMHEKIKRLQEHGHHSLEKTIQKQQTNVTTSTSHWSPSQSTTKRDVSTSDINLQQPSESKSKSKLSLSQNEIKRIKNLDQFSDSLEELYLSYNSIQTLDGLEHLHKLRVLNICENQIDSFDELNKIAHLSSLKELWFLGNPIYKMLPEQTYRSEVIKRLPLLTNWRLDGELVTMQEIEAAKANEEINDIDDTDHTFMDELEVILNQGMEKWIFAYYQFIELKQLLNDNTDGVITCNGPENSDSNNNKRGSSDNNANKSNLRSNNFNNRQKQRRKNDKNEDDENNEQKGNDNYGDQHHLFQPRCNHLNECADCSKQIDLFKGIIYNLQQQQTYHSSFVKAMDKMLQNGPNGPNGNQQKPAHEKKRKSKSKKKSSNMASYEPQNCFRAKGKIKIPRHLTQIIMPRKCVESITDFYHYLDKTVSIQYNNQQIINVNDDKKDGPEHDVVINLDLHDKQSKLKLFCIIKSNDAKSKIYQYKIDQLFIASDLYCLLPTSSRETFQIQPQLSKIREFMKSPENIDQILHRSKWNQLQVFDKKENKQRMALYITPQKLNETIRDYILHYKVIIIPIVMFRKNKYLIEYIVVIDSYSFGSIGVSLGFDKRGHLNISSLHLNWTAIKKQHEIAAPAHMKECECFNGVNPVIDHIHVGNPDDVVNKMKSYQSRYEMVAEVLHKVQDHAGKYIDNLHSKRNESMYSQSPSPSLSATNSLVAADTSSNSSSDTSWND